MTALRDSVRNGQAALQEQFYYALKANATRSRSIAATAEVDLRHSLSGVLTGLDADVTSVAVAADIHVMRCGVTADGKVQGLEWLERNPLVEPTPVGRYHVDGSRGSWAACSCCSMTPTGCLQTRP